MMDVTLYRLSIPFAIVTGTGAGILAALSWEVLRESPFGPVLKLMTLVMAIMTVYHGGLFVSGSETLGLQLLLILGYGLVVIALFAAISELSGDIRTHGAFRHQYLVFPVIVGLLLYAVGGPLSEVFFPPMLHWVHGLAGLFAIAGLSSPVHNGLDKGAWTELISDDTTQARRHAEWMVPMDDAILEILHSSSLILTPAVIAYNLGYSREEVNRRVTTLESKDLVERVERGKYRHAERGEQYLEGAPTHLP